MHLLTLRLGTKFSLVLLILIVGATSLIVIIYERNQHQSTMQQAASTLYHDAQRLGTQIRSQLDDLKRDIKFINQTPPIQGIVRSQNNGGVDPLDGSTLTQWRDRLAQIFTAVAGMYPHYTQIRFIGQAEGGHELVRVDRHADVIERMTQGLLQKKGDRDYVKNTLKLLPHHFYLSDINLNRDFGKLTLPYQPTLRVAMPVYDEAEPFGLLVINRDVAPLFSQLQGLLPTEVRLYLTNEQGDYLYHPDRDKRFGFEFGKPYRIQDEYPQMASLYQENSKIQERQLDVQVGEERHKLQFLRIAYDPQHPHRYLGVVLSIPHQHVLSYYNKHSYMQSYALIVTLGLAILALTYLFLRRITRPLASLTHSAKQIAQGQYDITIPPTGSPELEILADAMRNAANDVAQREKALANLNHELEQRVEARTTELREEQKSLANAQRIASMGSWEWELGNDDVYWSDEMYRILGLEAQQMRPSFQAFIGCIHPSDRAVVEETITKAIAHHGSFSIEHRLLWPDNTEHVVYSEGEVNLVANGSAVRVQGTLLNITERKLAEKRMSLLASVVEHSLEGILITDLELTIIDVNPAFTSITGYSAEEAIGKAPKLLSSGWHDKSHYQKIWHSLKETGQWQGEMTNRRKDGEIYTEWLTISSVYDQHGELSNYVGVFYDITEKKAVEQHITQLAYYDSLTELANRRLFEDRFEQSLRFARRNEQTVALLYIDLDRFKPVNDSLGHKAGDVLLKQVARRLQDSVRDSDTVARLGGDEFAIIMENINQVNVSHCAQAIIELLDKPFTIEGSEVFVGASIGISMFPSDGVDMATLIKHADIAMYRAKEEGRKTYQFFLPEMNAGVEERLALENALRYAMARGELELHYQPQVRLKDGRITGVEALLRWHHPEMGFISPARFIPIAEDSGLINEIGRWVLEQACQQRRAWQITVNEDFRVAVNLSARQFSSDVATMVEQVLRDTGLEANQLELEITESMVMQNADHAVQVLNALNKLGVQLAIDDFGTGYSSLSYLKRFPLHKVKVDRTFIKDLPNDEEDAAITNAVIAMGKTLGLTVLAEGTETLEQIEFLHEQLCDEVQGYFCSRPVPVQELDALLQAQYLPETPWISATSLISTSRRSK